MITNLLHQDPVDLQQYIKENCLPPCASSPSESTDRGKLSITTNYTDLRKLSPHIQLQKIIQIRTDLIEAKNHTTAL